MDQTVSKLFLHHQTLSKWQKETKSEENLDDEISWNYQKFADGPFAVLKSLRLGDFVEKILASEASDGLDTVVEVTHDLF